MAKQLTPKLRLRFDHLLFTWRNPSRRRAAAPAAELSTRLANAWRDRENVFREFEERYGDGHYSERKRLLDDDLADLESRPGIDLHAVLTILENGREEQIQNMRPGREVDLRRRLHEHRALIRDLRHQLLKVKLSYEAVLEASGPTWFAVVDELHDLQAFLALTERLDRLRLWLDLDPTQELDISGPYRRPKAGRQTTPWVTHVRQRLRQAGVDDPEDRLLIAVGLMPYRPVPSERQSSPVS